MFRPTERNKTHTIFYNTLYIFCDDLNTLQKIFKVVKNLLLNKKVNGKKGHKPLADTSNLQEEVIKKLVFSKSNSLVSSTPVAKKRSISKVLDVSANIPLRSNRSINILKILKTAVHDFDQEKVYINDAKMYWVLVNWLRKIYGYEITGQLHLKQVCDDGDYYYLYCDLTIKNPDNPHLKALLELLVTALISKLNGHIEQVFMYEKQLHSQEIWIVHFSHEDYIVTNPYWPWEKL
ncbi:hypothetical protein C1645_879355 [Glomus cerebriforme]|uniref:Uncharacterized protein n=1 Tax=Glomus cerebriforme TaxID=658196 RepID=A0A397SL50_9GLOM|nr:hypothetical protein C1645_879355 [Glomus cerebriforme]